MSKSKELAVIGHSVPKGSALDRSEHELAEAMIDQFEAFYRQGVILSRIDSKRQYEDAGYPSFSKYMDDRMPHGIKKSHAHRLIKAKDVRPLLPQLSASNSPNGDEPVWTEGSIRPLTHKAFSPSDQRRLGKKIATRVRKGETLTEKLVKAICDEDRGVDNAKRAKKAVKLKGTETAAEHIRTYESEVKLWQSSLESVSGEFWEDAESDDRGCVKDFIAALSELASYLRG